MKLFLLTVTAFFYSQVDAQPIPWTEVPAKVINTFVAAYPEVNFVEWKKMADFYEATCTRGCRACTHITLNSSGEVVQTADKIPSRQLPPAASAYIKNNYPDPGLLNCHKIYDDCVTPSFKVEMTDRYLLFDVQGKYIDEVITVKPAL